MTTYRDVAAVGEFRALFGGRAAGTAASTMTMLAMAVLVYADTGSPLLSALAFLAGSLPQVLAAMTLLALADRLPPRRLLAGWELLLALSIALLATGVLPIWAELLVLTAAGVGNGITSGSSYALLGDILPGQYVLGRSLLNMADGGMQILGYGAGGALLAALGAVPALWAAAALTAASGAIYRAGLAPRPARASHRAAFRRTWLNNSELLGNPRARRLLLAQWLPNGLIVGAEALYVPYAAHSAGILFTTGAVGMLLGDTVVGRWTTARQRSQLTLPLYLLLAAPYLAFFSHPGTAEAATLVAAASFGYSACLGLQEQLLHTVPEHIRGHTLGLAGAGMMTTQAVAAAGTGALATALPAGTVIAIAGAGSLLATMALIPALRRPRATGSSRAVSRQQPPTFRRRRNNRLRRPGMTAEPAWSFRRPPRLL